MIANEQFKFANQQEQLAKNQLMKTDVTIKELAHTIKDVVGFTGDLTFDTSKPDGTPRKLMDVSKINDLGWKHKINLREGIEKVYNEVKDIDFQTLDR